MLADQLKNIRESWEEMLFLALVTLTAGLLMFELTALFLAPVADSYLWWGDEFWLMSEFKAQILTGRFHHPYALGSTLQQGSGPLFSNMWVTALLYGGAASLFKHTDVVIVGRAITALLATGLIFGLFEMIRRLTGDRLVAIFGVILLISSRSFFFTSHSARYDILSAGAIAFGFYVLVSYKLDSLRRTFVCGVLCSAGLLISVHVPIALLLTGAIAAFLTGKRRFASVAAYSLGAVTTLAAIFIISLLLQSNGSSSSSGFALNIHDIPALRIYSRSVQLANLTQKVSTISSFAFAYLILVASSIVAVIVHAIRQRVFTVNHTAWIAFALICSWLEFESAAPTSYLIYILPVLSILIAIAISQYLRPKISHVMIAAVSVALIVFAVRDDWHARNICKKITSANDETVSSALAAIGQDTTHPLVLAFTPAVHRVAMDTAFRLMTTQFVEYPQTNESIDSVIRAQRVKYVMLYRSALKPDYMREVGPLTEASKRMGVLVWEKSGILTDIGRSYFAALGPELDTLQIYRIRD